MKTLYVIGNEYLEDDSLAHKVGQILKVQKKLTIRNVKFPTELLDEEGEIVMLDVVKGIDAPLLITDAAQLKTRSLVTGHDMDFSFFLNLLKEMGMEKKIKIIGIPQEGDASRIAREVTKWL